MDNEEFDLEEDKRAQSNQTGMDKMMNFMKENSKLVIVAIVVILLLILMAVFSGGGGSNNNTGVTISEEKLTVTTDTGNQLKLMKDGKEVTGVVWSSKDETVATVDKTGVIKGKKVGKTTIIGKYDGYEYKCEVTVTEGDPNLKVESLKFSESGTILMPVGSTYQVPIQMTPPEARPKNKIFSSSKPAVASIDNTGLITANAKGEAMIRVAVNDAEKMASIKIKVVEGQVTPGIYTLPTSIAFEEKEITLTEGETKTLTYHQEPAEASTDYVMWVSADEEVATVFNGELIAKKAGNIEVAIVSMGLMDKMVVHVKSGTVPVTGITLSSEENITMNVGDQKKIVATVEPSNATNQVVTYLVDNPSVVSVDNDGNISAIGSGGTTITVSPSANLEIKKTIYVTVNEEPSYVPPSDDGGNNGGDNGGDNGGNNGGETVTVGSVIVTGTNNAVSTDLPGMEVESTIITMTSSGNVDEIRYCYYNKAVTSSCTANSIYGGEFNLPQTTLTTKTTYVIKAIPYYQGQEGTEIVRYVTIKPGSGSTPPPDDPPVNGVGTITINGLYDSKTAAEANATSSVTVTVTKSGNVDSVKYCSTTGSSCSTYDKTLTMSSSSNSFTFNTTGTYMFEFVPVYNNTDGTKVTGKYIKIGTAASPTKGYKIIPANILNEDSSAATSNKKSGNQKVTFNITDSSTSYVKVCKGTNCDPINGTRVSNNGEYIITGTGLVEVNVNEYTVAGVRRRGPDKWYVYIEASAQQDKCWCTTGSANIKCRWGSSNTTYNKDVSTSLGIGQNECKAYSETNGNQGCFLHEGELIWGSYMGVTNYTYQSHKTQSQCVKVEEGCFCRSDGLCKTTSGTTGYTKIEGVTKTQCSRYIGGKNSSGGDQQTGCFIKKSDRSKVWGAYMAKTTEYEYDYDNSTSREKCIPTLTIGEVYFKVRKSDGKFALYAKDSSGKNIDNSKLVWTRYRVSDDVSGNILSFTSVPTGAYIPVNVAPANKPSKVEEKRVNAYPYVYSVDVKGNHLQNYTGGLGAHYPFIVFNSIKVTPSSSSSKVLMCYYTVDRSSYNETSTPSCITGATGTDTSTYDRKIENINTTALKLTNQNNVYRYYYSSRNITNFAIEFQWLNDRGCKTDNDSPIKKDIILELKFVDGSGNSDSVKSFRKFRLDLSSRADCFTPSSTTASIRNWTVKELAGDRSWLE